MLSFRSYTKGISCPLIHVQNSTHHCKSPSHLPRPPTQELKPTRRLLQPAPKNGNILLLRFPRSSKIQAHDIRQLKAVLPPGNLAVELKLRFGGRLAHDDLILLFFRTGEVYFPRAKRVFDVLKQHFHRTDVRKTVAGTPRQDVSADATTRVFNNPRTRVAADCRK